jgi:hypothetical protein
MSYGLYSKICRYFFFVTVYVGVEDATSDGTDGVFVGSGRHTGATTHDGGATSAVRQPSQTAGAVCFGNAQRNVD